MIRYQTTISLNQDDKAKEDQLTSTGIAKMDIYRTGIKILLERLEKKQESEQH